MSFWGTLGKIGTSLLGIGSLAGGAESGRQQGRETEAQANARVDKLNQDRYVNELAAARLNLGAPTTRAQQSVRGDVLANAQPFQWTGGTRQVGNIPVPQSSGGLSPGIFSDNTRQLGGLLSSGALKDQQTNGGRVVGAPPPVTPLPQANGGDSFLSLIGQIAPFASMIPGVVNAFKDDGSGATGEDPLSAFYRTAQQPPAYRG